MGNIFIVHGSSNVTIVSRSAQGSHGGRDWEYCPKAGVVEMTIRYSEVVHSLSFKLVNENSTEKHYGGKGGTKEETFTINWPNEYLTMITGTTVTLNEEEVVGSLTFCTNRKTLEIKGSLNDENAKPFEFYEESRAIVGLYGKESNFINSIGVHYKDLPAPNKVISETTIVEDIPRDVGPWGGKEGKAWDTGCLPGPIIEIEVHVGNGVIHALHYRYQKSTQDPDSPPVVVSNKHGGDDGDGENTTIYRIKLGKDNCPTEEYLVGISGFYWALDGKSCLECEYQVVRSITAYTNMAKYGPFGDEIGTFFISPACANAKLVGFHGRSGAYLNAIGVHVEYLSSSTPSELDL